MQRPEVAGVVFAAPVVGLRRMEGAWTGTLTLRLSCLSMSQMSPLSKAVLYCVAGAWTIELLWRGLVERDMDAPMLFEVEPPP